MSAPAPVRDPRKSLRGVGAGLLVLESFTVMFAMLAVFGISNTNGDVATGKLQLLGTIAVALFLAGFVMRRPWGRTVGTVLQGVVLVAGIVVWPLLFVLLMFGPMWGYYLHMWRTLPPEPGPIG